LGFLFQALKSFQKRLPVSIAQRTPEITGKQYFPLIAEASHMGKVNHP
jgi:hypothetical protein